ncbi:hypothetical protein NDU88_002080 [Pleurodeles waltl]|uniref:Uncharacterized protein n=1 Tax=Pleurodeles waltl TaxID=8319 RepID=A0AAV7REN6_PLEWA|nr:hypothetical protein NDU88_002080 [Pleurodeles waltl]
MSPSGDASAGVAFDPGKLKGYTVAQLKQFCKDFACPVKGSAKKEGHTKEEEEDEVQSIHHGIVGGAVNSRKTVSRAGSSVSPKGLTPEELQGRQAEREYHLELEKLKLKMEREKEDRRMAIEEKKILLAHELSLSELDQRSQSSGDGGSNSTVQP